MLRHWLAHFLRKSKWGLSKWGLKVLVHNCPGLPTIVVILRRKFLWERGAKGPQKCTIVDDCAQIAESGLKPPFESPRLDFPEFLENAKKGQYERIFLAPNLVAHDCGHPLSRYTCRATRVAADFLDFIACCRCSTGVALHPLKILVSHLPPPLCREVSHRNLGLKRCRLPGGVAATVAGCRATLCN